jgi:L-cysteine:1D-myo-inositol 2-amino-2-deoxy-alpha-D-glucopyranoside ligase
VECTAIALEYLDREDQDFVIDLQGGGSDLIFPHHFMSAQLIKAATGRNFARHFIHTGMIGYEGEKMSKSKGNLVFVSKLLEQGIDPLVIRWALLKGHYQTDRNWTDELLMQASTEVELVRSALSKSEVVDPNQSLKNIADALANNLDTESALEMIINWSQESLDLDKKGEFVNSAGLMSRGIDALLGLSF